MTLTAQSPLQLETGPPLDEVAIACVLRDLLNALDYLHGEGKIHRQAPLSGWNDLGLRPFSELLRRPQSIHLPAMMTGCPVSCSAACFAAGTLRPPTFC